MSVFVRRKTLPIVLRLQRVEPRQIRKCYPREELPDYDFDAFSAQRERDL